MSIQIRKIQTILNPDIKNVVITGHVNPDGDCVGSCMALALYLRKNYPELDVRVLLEKPKEQLLFLRGTDTIISAVSEEMASPDLFILLDASSLNRMMAGAERLFNEAGHRACIDHHKGSTIEAEYSCIEPETGSCAEVLFELLEPEKLDEAIAEAIYTGIIHDTGIMQYTNTRPRTYEILACLTRFPINTAAIIYDSFKSRSYRESRILGFCLDKARLFGNGRGIISTINPDDMKHYGVGKKDVGAVVSALKLVQGTDVALFAYPLEDGSYKISIRTSEKSDATILAQKFNGGGHDRAAGGSFEGTQEKAEKAMILEAEAMLEDLC